MRMLRSDVALHLILALQSDLSLSLAELARAVAASPSSVQGGLAIMQADGLVSGKGLGRSRRYQLADTPAMQHLIGLAFSVLGLVEAVGIIARANPAIEFVGRRGDELVIVFSATGDALGQSDAARSLHALTDPFGVRLSYQYHRDVRRELLADPSLRNRMRFDETLYGDLDHTFPNRSQHGVATGRFLGRPNDSLRLPSQRLLRRLARDYGLASLRLFGSATRTDFRPDSDVDIAVRYRPGEGPSLRTMREIERQLEQAMDRDVDLLEEEDLEPAVRDAVEREAVPLV
jgi:predicted nucleotidyltransferase